MANLNMYLLLFKKWLLDHFSFLEIIFQPWLCELLKQQKDLTFEETVIVLFEGKSLKNNQMWLRR